MNEKYNKPIMRMPVVTPEGVGDNGNGYSSKDLQESLPTNPSYNVYIGARYVPLIYQGSDGSANWEKDTVYEPLTIVLYNHETYTSKSFVPANILPTDTKYWVKTSNFNAEFMKIENMVSDLSQNVDSLNDDMETAQDSISANANNISTNTADITAIKAVNQAQQTAIENHTTSITEILEKNAQQDERISDLESKSSAASQNISNLTNEVNNLKTSQTEQDTKIEDIENTIEQQSTDISNIQSKNSQQDTSIAELQTGLNSANSNIITLQTDMQGVKDLNTAQGIDIDNLKNRSDSMEEAIETLQNTDTQHTASIQANATAIGGLNAKVQTNTDAIAALTTQGNQTAGAVTELATKNAQQDTAISQIQQAANTNMGNINTLNNEVSQLDTRMESAEYSIANFNSLPFEIKEAGSNLTFPNDRIYVVPKGTYQLQGSYETVLKYFENDQIITPIGSILVWEDSNSKITYEVDEIGKGTITFDIKTANIGNLDFAKLSAKVHRIEIINTPSIGENIVFNITLNCQRLIVKTIDIINDAEVTINIGNSIGSVIEFNQANPISVLSIDSSIIQITGNGTLNIINITNGNVEINGNNKIDDITLNGNALSVQSFNTELHPRIRASRINVNEKVFFTPSVYVRNNLREFITYSLF